MAIEAPEPEEKEIGTVTYRVRPLAFSEGRKVLMRLLKIIGPIFSAALKGAMLDAQMGRTDVGGPGMLSEIMLTLPAVLSDDDLEYFSKVFGAASWYLDSDGKWCALRKDAKENAQEYHFAKRYLDYMRWLTFCIEVNFKDFFSGVASGESTTGLQAFAAMMTGPKAAATPPEQQPPSDD